MKEWLIRAKTGLIFLSCLISYMGRAQVDFTVPDTVCIRDSMQAVNLSREASSYYWNFCSGNLAYVPEGDNRSGYCNQECSNQKGRGRE